MAAPTCLVGNTSENTDISQLGKELVKCYKRILDSQCLPLERQQHQKFIDDFRDSPYCIGCGVLLLLESDIITVYLGLQLIESFVRFRWDSLNPQEHFDLKHKLLVFSSNVGSGNVVLPAYVKEAVAKVIIEITKKCWPQHWPTFIDDICGIGNTAIHMELVLLVYRRLMEDLTSYDTSLQQQRKADMLTEIKKDTSLSPLFHLLITILKNGPSHLCELSVSTLLSLVEWVNLKYLTMNNCQIVILLFSLISSPSSTVELRINACDCLVEIFSRKGEIRTTAEYRKMFLQFVSKDVLQWIHQVTISHIREQSEDEQQYLLVKRLCHLLVQLGTCQIVPLSNSEVIPLSEDYVLVMLVFSQHPSQLICSKSLELWSAFLNHHDIKTSQVLLSILPQLVKGLREKQLKVGDPTLYTHPSCIYSRFDFNGQVEHNIFFSKFKSMVNRVITSSTLLVPLPASEQASVLVQELIEKPQPCAQFGVPIDGIRSSPVYLEWDAATSYLECWVSGLKLGDGLLQQAASTGVSIVKSLLTFSPSDPTLVSCHLKMLEGGLQSFVMFDEQNLLQKYLEKVLTYVVYPSEQINKVTLSREQKHVRLGALYCLTNIVKHYTTSILPATDQLFDHYIQLVSSDYLLFSEKCMFIETFTTLSHFRTQEEQFVMLSKLLNEVILIITNKLRSVVSSLPLLIQFLGLDKDITDPMTEETSIHLNRGQLCYCAHAMMGVLQRSTPREKRLCGAPDNSDGSSLRSNLFVLMSPLLLEFVLPLIKTLHQLWSFHSKPLLSRYFQGIHLLHQYDRETILGIMGTNPLEEDTVNKIQLQLMTAYDQCVMAVGFACPTFGLAVLDEIKFVDVVLENVFTHLSETNQLRVKPIIRNLMVPLVLSCSIDHWDVSLVPLLAQFCHITFNCLQRNWSDIMERLTTHQHNEDEEQMISHEVLQHQLTINLTRQYLILIETVCLKRKEITGISGSHMTSSDGVDDMVDVSMETSNIQGGKGQQLSDLAVHLMRNETMQRILFFSAFAPLTWMDGHTTRKCINLATLIFDKIPVTEFSEDVILQLMEQVLMAFQTHGEDPAITLLLTTLALQIYETAVLHVPSLCHMMASLPQCDQVKVDRFNQKVIAKANDPSNKVTKFTKWKREEFKKLLSGIIGTPLGQLHKRTPVFLDLPSLIVKKEHRMRARHSDTTAIEDVTCLFGDDDL